MLPTPVKASNKRLSVANKCLDPNQLLNYLTAECTDCRTNVDRLNCVLVHGQSSMNTIRRRHPWSFEADGTFKVYYLPELCPFAFLGKKHAGNLTPGLATLMTRLGKESVQKESHGYSLRPADLKCPFGADCPWAHTDRELWFHPIHYKNREEPCTRGDECQQNFCAYYHPKEEDDMKWYDMMRPIIKKSTDKLRQQIAEVDKEFTMAAKHIEAGEKKYSALISMICELQNTKNYGKINRPTHSMSAAAAAAPEVTDVADVIEDSSRKKSSASSASDLAECNHEAILNNEDDKANQQISINICKVISVSLQKADNVMNTIGSGELASLNSYVKRLDSLTREKGFIKAVATIREEVCSISRHALELLMNTLLDHFNCNIAPSWSLTDKCVQLKPHMNQIDTRKFFELKEECTKPDHHPRGLRQRYQISLEETVSVLYLLMKVTSTTIKFLSQPKPEMTDNKAETKKGDKTENGETPLKGSRHSRVPKQFKTMLCRNWKLHGACAHGDKCAYAHGSSELKQ